MGPFRFESSHCTMQSNNLHTSPITHSPELGEEISRSGSNFTAFFVKCDMSIYPNIPFVTAAT